MTADDLSTPLGRQAEKRRPPSPAEISVPQLVAGVAGAVFALLAIVWAVFVNDPLGGEPTAVVPASSSASGRAPDTATPPARGHPSDPGPAASPGDAEGGSHRGNGRAATRRQDDHRIIDGKSGKQPGSRRSRQFDRRPRAAARRRPSRSCWKSPGMAPFRRSPRTARGRGALARPRKLPRASRCAAHRHRGRRPRRQCGRHRRRVGQIAGAGDARLRALRQRSRPWPRAPARQPRVLLQVPMEPFDYPTTIPARRRCSPR